MKTAEIVATALNLPAPSRREGLKEKNFGTVQGIPKDELAELNPALLEQILRRNPEAEFAGSESTEDFGDRVVAAFEAMGARHAGQRVLVIIHGWVMDVMTRHVQGLPRHAVLHLKRKNGECIGIQVSQHAQSYSIGALFTGLPLVLLRPEREVPPVEDSTSRRIKSTLSTFAKVNAAVETTEARQAPQVGARIHRYKACGYDSPDAYTGFQRRAALSETPLQ